MNRKARRLLKSIGLGGKDKPVDNTTIQKEYIQACAEAGELQYKIGEFQEQLTKLNERLRKLNRAYAESLTEQSQTAVPAQSGEGVPSAPSSSPQGVYSE